MSVTVGPDTGRPGHLRLVPPVVLVVLAVAMVALVGHGVRARSQGQASSADSAAVPGAPLSWLPAQGTSLPGIGRLEGLSQPCTAWLLDAGPDPASPAHAVTAGRCTGVQDSQTVLRDEAVSGVTVTFRLLADAPDTAAGRPVVAGVEDVAWASVRGTDLALLRLSTTNEELAEAGIPAITATAPLPAQGQLLVAGLPVTGGADGSVLRGTLCQAGQQVELAEGPWLLRAAQSSDCPGVLVGSVGSPALDESGAAVGLVSTTTIASGAGSPCQPRRPCELESGVVSVRPDTTYLVDVSGLADCFDGGVLRLGGTCPLEDPATVVPADLGRSSAPAGSEVELDLGADAGSSVDVLTGMLGATDCWSDTGWVTADVADDRATVIIPDEQGLAVVCVGSPAQPTPLRVTVTAAGPDPALIRIEQTDVPGGVAIAPVLSPPELASATWTIEPGTGADCSTVEGFVDASGVQPTFVPASDLPATVCLIAADAAGNPGVPVAIPVG